MKKILFIDIANHKNTQSGMFFYELLRTRFEVSVRYVNSKSDPNMPTKAEMSKYDCIIWWQFSPPLWRSKLYCKPQIYVPMYDNETYNYPKWFRIKLDGGRVISFTDKEGRFLKWLGLNVLEVRYFTPSQEFHPGSPRRLFLWDRGYVQLRTIMQLFKPSELDEIVYRCQRSKVDFYKDLARKLGFNIRIVPIEQYLEREEYLKIFYDCGIFVAPRPKEGIGMSFLEATALGKCVVSHNDATMNEYMKNNETGILVNLMRERISPLSISEEQIRDIQKRAYNMHKKGREIWDAVYKNAILDFVDTAIMEYNKPSIFSCIWWLCLLPFHFAFDIKTYIKMRCCQVYVKYLQKKLMSSEI